LVLGSNPTPLPTYVNCCPRINANGSWSDPYWSDIVLWE
jgi:hypothetical protein